MKILLVGKVIENQRLRMKAEAQKRGHTIEITESGALGILVKDEIFEPLLDGQKFHDYDLIYFWTLGYKRWEWHTAARYLNKKFGTIIVDSYRISKGLNYDPTPTLTYLLLWQAGIAQPKTAVIFSDQQISVIDKNFSFPVVAKESMIHQGKGIYKLDSIQALKELRKDRKKPYPLVVREFIPNDGDIRIFTIGSKAIGAMKRTPRPGDFRSNISIGGTGSKFDLEANRNIRELAERSARIVGVEIAGVDVLIDKNTSKPYVLEVNECPGFAGLEKYTGINVAGAIIEYFEKLYVTRH